MILYELSLFMIMVVWDVTLVVYRVVPIFPTTTVIHLQESGGLGPCDCLKMKALCSLRLWKQFVW